MQLLDSSELDAKTIESIFASAPIFCMTLSLESLRNIQPHSSANLSTQTLKTIIPVAKRDLL